MPQPEPPARHWFTEAESKAILHRAVQLDELRRAGWSDLDLLNAAADVGVSRDVVELAIAEALARRSKVSMRRRVIRGTGTAAVPLALAGLGASTMLATVHFGVSTIIPLFIVGGTSVALALDSRRAGAFAQYWLRNAALWGGFLTAGSLFFFLAETATLVIVGAPVLGGTVALALMRLLHRAAPAAGAGGERPGGRLARGIAAVRRRMHDALAVLLGRPTARRSVLPTPRPAGVYTGS